MRKQRPVVMTNLKRETGLAEGSSIHRRARMLNTA